MYARHYTVPYSDSHRIYIAAIPRQDHLEIIENGCDNAYNSGHGMIFLATMGWLVLTAFSEVLVVSRVHYKMLRFGEVPEKEQTQQTQQKLQELKEKEDKILEKIKWGSKRGLGT